jgi:hypothetical protein
MKQLSSDEGISLLVNVHEVIRPHLKRVDAGIGVSASAELDSSLDQLNAAREKYASATDEVLNDIFVLETYVDLFRSYGNLWQQISTQHYSESWLTLQDANDSLRLILKWSNLNLNPLVNQLSALESLYPYKIFSSCGFVVDHFECSICGNDIDSFDCKHRKNELYRGQRAYGIARKIIDMDHIALVENPDDKRCVVSMPNDAPGFSGVKYLGNALNQRHLKVSNFGGVAWGKKQVANAEFAKIGRNDPCHCESGKKFKHCCIEKKFREIEHAEILPTRSVFENCGL